MCFDFLYSYVWNISRSKKKYARCDQKCVLIFMQSTLYCRPILIKLALSRQIFEKYSNIISHENPSSGSRVVPRGQTDRRNEDYSFFFAILRTRLKLHTKRQKKSGKTTEETFVCVRPERVNKWPNSMVAT
jgi:hypothetical protein